MAARTIRLQEVLAAAVRLLPRLRLYPHAIYAITVFHPFLGNLHHAIRAVFWQTIQNAAECPFWLLVLQFAKMDFSGPRSTLMHSAALSFTMKLWTRRCHIVQNAAILYHRTGVHAL